MMTKVYLFFLLAGFSFLSHGQESMIDSLKKEYRQAETDSLRLSTADKMVRHMAFKQPDSAKFYGTSSLKLAFQNQDIVTAGSLMLNIGTAHYAQGNYDSALHHWENAAVLSDQTAEKSIKPLAINNMAIILQNTGRIQEAIETFSKALKIYQERKDTARIGRGTFNLGKAHVAAGQDSIGLYHISESIKIYRSQGSKALKNLANAYNEIGAVHYYNGEYKRALDNYLKSVDFYEQHGDTLAANKPRGNISAIYIELNYLEEAETAIRKIISIREKNNQFQVHFNYNNLGNTLLDLGKTDEATIWLHKALSMRMESGLTGLVISTAIRLGDTFSYLNESDSSDYYYRLAFDKGKELDEAEFKAQSLCAYGNWLWKQKKYDLALPILLDCYAVADTIHNNKLLKIASQGLHEIYSERQDFKKAYQYLVQSQQLGDSLLNEDLIRQTTKLEAKYSYENELTQKQNEIQLLETREKLSELRTVILGIGILLILFIAVFLIILQLRKKRQVQVIAKFKESMTHMIAHDLKNPLSVIMNSDNDQKSNKQMANQMLQLVNNMLDVHRFESTQVKLNISQCSIREILNEAQVHVEPLLNEKNLILKIETHDDYTVSVDKGLIVRVFVNLLTNAIKYSPSNGKIKVTLRPKDDTLQTSVSDEGRGISGEEKDIIFKSFGQIDPKDSGGVGSTGLGLSFVKLALQAHQSKIELASEVGKGSIFSFDLKMDGVQKISSTESPTVQFEISAKAKKIIEEKQSVLRTFDLYQIGDIEKALSDIKGRDQASDHWIEEVLNSVYAGNQEKYEQLLEGFA